MFVLIDMTSTMRSTLQLYSPTGLEFYHQDDLEGKTLIDLQWEPPNHLRLAKRSPAGSRAYPRLKSEGKCADSAPNKPANLEDKR